MQLHMCNVHACTHNRSIHEHKSVRVVLQLNCVDRVTCLAGVVCAILGVYGYNSIFAVEQ